MTPETVPRVTDRQGDAVVKATVRVCLTATPTVRKPQKIARVGGDMERFEPLCPVGGNVERSYVW